MILSASILQASTGATAANAALWLAPLQTTCDLNLINTPLRAAAFLSQVGVESGCLATVIENLNYSAQGLADTWAFRYAMDPHARPRVPNALALKFAHNPQAIANNCYAKRNGNGDEASGDGWRYRGRGPIQITGLANYTACAIATHLDLVGHPELLEQPMNGAASAGWFWSNAKLNPLADGRQIIAISKAINLGNPNALGTPNGLVLRQSMYAAGAKALGV
jgi:putative chitinase